MNRTQARAILASADFVASDVRGSATLRAPWPTTHPKSALYPDSADFAVVRLTPVSVALNADFGPAFRLTDEDLRST